MKSLACISEYIIINFSCLNKAIKMQKNVKEMSFEEALRELQEIVQDVETKDNALDLIVQKYERGVELKKRCDLLLKEAKLKVEKIISEEETEEVSF